MYNTQTHQATQTAPGCVLVRSPDNQILLWVHSQADSPGDLCTSRPIRSATHPSTTTSSCVYTNINSSGDSPDFRVCYGDNPITIHTLEIYPISPGDLSCCYTILLLPLLLWAAIVLAAIALLQAFAAAAAPLLLAAGPSAMRRRGGAELDMESDSSTFVP